MPLEFRDFDGDNYVSHEWVVAGHYTQTSDIGEANCRVCEKREGAHTVYGAHDSRQVWLPDTEDNRAFLSRLDNYALLNEETASEVEDEWEVEAWHCWLKDELIATLPEELQSGAEFLDTCDKERDTDLGRLFEVYRNAMEASNSYPVCEDYGVSVRVHDIKHAFLIETEKEVFTVAWELASQAGIGLDSPLSVMADWLEETGHPLADVVRSLSRVENGV